MADLLNVENLSAGYGEAVILDRVSLSLAAGQTLALLGRNGTGKTTLINTLAGATRQHAGRVMLGGVEGAVASARGALEAEPNLSLGQAGPRAQALGRRCMLPYPPGR